MGSPGCGPALVRPAAAWLLASLVPGHRRSAAAVQAFAVAAFPPRPVDRARRTAVAPDPGATAAWGLQAERCWSLSKGAAGRRASGNQPGGGGMLESVLRRPGRGHCCLLLQTIRSFIQRAGLSSSDRPPTEVRGRAGVLLGFGPVEGPRESGHHCCAHRHKEVAKIEARSETVKHTTLFQGIPFLETNSEWSQTQCRKHGAGAVPHTEVIPKALDAQNRHLRGLILVLEFFPQRR